MGRTCPAGAGLVERVDHVERLRLLCLERVELLLQKNVLLGDVCEDEREARLVRGILQGVVEDLVHGRAG